MKNSYKNYAALLTILSLVGSGAGLAAADTAMSDKLESTLVDSFDDPIFVSSEDMPSYEETPDTAESPLRKEHKTFVPLMGDVNLDGHVDSSDALEVLRNTVKLYGGVPEGMAAADVNADGAVTAADSLMILRHSIGIPNSIVQPTAYTGSEIVWYKNSSGEYFAKDSSGEPVSGMVSADGVKCIFDNGRLLTGNVTINGREYHIESDGAYLDGWQYGEGDDSGKKRFYRSGSLLTGMNQLWGYRYLFDDETGYAKTNVWHDGIYYFTENGAAAKGLTVIDSHLFYFTPDNTLLKDSLAKSGGRLYYFGSDGEAVTGFKLISDKLYSFGSDGAAQTGWVIHENKKYYMGDDGAAVVGMNTIGDMLYLFGSDGAVITGEQIIDDKIYYFGSDNPIDSELYGAAALGWYTLGEKKLYFDEDFAAVTGLQIIGGKGYFFSENGEMQTGFQAIDRNKYYFGDKGAMYVGFNTIDDKKYYFDKNGIMQVGFTEIDGKKYYFDGLGEMQTGWKSLDGSKYYFGDNGVMQVGFKTIDKKKYYFGDNGIMQTGFTAVFGKKYYFDESGVMQVGWKMLDGKKYYFDKNGVMQTGFTEADGNKYYFDGLGVMQVGLKSIDGNKYYFDESGVMQLGWKMLDGKKYYFDESGVMQVGFKTIDKKKYYFGDNGVMQTGLIVIDGKNYYFDGSGVMQTGLKTLDGNIYYFADDGAMRAGWQTIGGKKYYFRTDGRAANGFTEIGGDTYYFSQGVMITDTAIGGYRIDKNGICTLVEKKIDVKSVLQYPELPTGCESTALTALLNYYGYSVDKLTIVRKYLPKMDFYWAGGELYGADFRTTFAGNPESENAYGCYAPCIVTTANNYFSDNGYSARAHDLTGTSFDNLLTNYVSKGTPVLIWITMGYLSEPYLTSTWKTPDGGTVQWLANEHCVVLTGYNLDTGRIYVADPLAGNTSYDYDRIKYIYGRLGKQAVEVRE